MLTILKLKMYKVAMYHNDDILNLTLDELEERYKFIVVEEIERAMVHCQTKEDLQKLQEERQHILDGTFRIEPTKIEYFNQYKHRIIKKQGGEA